MEDDQTDVIEQLLVIAAGIMEDASAAIILKQDRSREERINIARDAARRVGALAAAATALDEIAG